MPDSLDFMLRLATFSIIHSLLAAQRIKERLQLLGHGSLRGYRLFYNLASLLLFAWVMLAWQSTAVLYVIPGIWSLVCYGLQLAVLWAGYLCLRQTGLGAFLGTDFTHESDTPQLVTTGCYAVVRHPLYLMGTLFLLLNPVITTRWIALTLFTIPYFIVGALLEERRMVRLFGEAYRTYQHQVPFILPHPQQKRSTQTNPPDPSN